MKPDLFFEHRNKEVDPVEVNSYGRPPRHPKLVWETSDCISTMRDGSSMLATTVEPERREAFEEKKFGRFSTSKSPASDISNIPISFVEPKRF